MNKDGFFRKKAMEQMHSFEKIDEYIKITSPSVYVIMFTLLILAISVGLWGFYGNVTDKVYVGGVVFPNHGSVGESITHAGVVRELFFYKGDYVEKNQSLALVSVQDAFSIVSASCSGVILSSKSKGERFESFEPIVNLIVQDTTTIVRDVVGFVDFKDKRELSVGMEVQVSPADLLREKYGYIYGIITQISKYPISKTEATENLKIADFANDIFPLKGSAFEIRIQLALDPRNHNGFLWSFSHNEHIDMGVGTFCKIQIVTKKRSIYEFLFETIEETRKKAVLWFE